MGFSLKHDNQTPTLKREYNKYSEVLVSKISLFYSSSKLQTPRPPFQHNEQGQHVRIGQKNGWWWGACAGQARGDGSPPPACAQNALRITCNALRRITHYVQASGEQSRRRSGNRPGGVGASCKLPGNRSMGCGVRTKGGTKGAPRGQWVAPTNLTVTRH